MRILKRLFGKLAVLFRYRLYGAQLGPGMSYIVWASSKEEALAKLYAKMHADPKYQDLIQAPELPPDLELRAAIAKAHFRRRRK